MWRARFDVVAGALWRRQRRLMCTIVTPQLETCISPAAALPIVMTLEQCQQSRLLRDLGGRYVYTCMRQFAPILGIQIPRFKTEELLDWTSTPANRNLVEAFWDFNNNFLHLFSPLDLEALLSAYMQQETQVLEHYVRGSILSMAVNVACQMKSPPVECITEWEFRSALWDCKKISFDNYLPGPGQGTQKLLIALFRILFGREVEEVVLQHQQRLDDPDPECTLYMQRRGAYGIPPLLKLYADQSFGLSYRIREKATQELSRHRRERFASFEHDETVVTQLRTLLHVKEKLARVGGDDWFREEYLW